MSSYMSPREAAVFQSVLPQFEADGFAVFVRPSADMLPAFLKHDQPHAVAYKGDRRVAIEVLAQNHGDGVKLERLRQILSDHPEWEFQVIYAPPAYQADETPVSARDVIDSQLRQIETALASMGAPAALLIAWAAFEAAARHLHFSKTGWPRGGTGLVSLLASEGYVTPDEAEALRSLSQLRDELAHGHLDVRINQEQVERLVAITRTLLQLED